MEDVLPLSALPAPLSRSPRAVFRWFTCASLLSVGLFVVAPVSANEAAKVVSQINQYRESGRDCAGDFKPPAGPLATSEVLAGVPTIAGQDLGFLLQRAGYQAAQAQAVRVTGPEDVAMMMTVLQQQYCEVLMNPAYADVGVSREGKRWQLVMARSLLSSGMGDWEEAGREVLDLVNEVRGESRTCGNETFPSTLPLAWNDELASAALDHSHDMAKQNYFSHTGRDNSQVGERVGRQDYEYQVVGENLAAGHGSAKQAVAGWLMSPGHCANLMNPQFTEMGAAYVVNPASDSAIFWTQVFAAPKE
ncbi:CAP domain-containing protein [Halopseudomonas laoshanensis]|uniref:CAP domain-containing protein n=1 Tax=Halopseudomonas laoshanensis TaxID=2268758 RepID=A0A7V7KYM4_9GAMM|nr:CAP domain-containing protein [Halopseudomonas laoshanensis]